MSAKRRAITDDEKLERREAILNATVHLLQRSDYTDISIDRIARKTGLAKGTVFLYFRTKEELFLHLQEREYSSWFQDVNSRLNALLKARHTDTVHAFVWNIVSSVKDHPLMIRLSPILHIILERNIDYVTALGFKRFLQDELLRTGRLIEKCLPFLRRNEGAGLLLQMHILFIGLTQLSRPAPLVKRIIEEEEGMDSFRIDFEKELTKMITQLINGMNTIRKK